ncbi:hypothetical protein ACA910_002886 [Epithemia clementina (nom. ined.)]
MESLIHMTLLSLLACTAIAIIRIKDLFACVMLAGIYGLMSASFFVMMDAVDVAFTEASVGAGISTLLMLTTLAMTGRYESGSRFRPGFALLIVAFTGALLIYGTMDMPSFGDPEAPVHQHVAPHYLNDSGSEIGVPNIVTSVLASYRGFDTFGEAVVIFTAGMGVLAMLHLLPAANPSATSPVVARMQDHMILRIVAKILIPLILLFGLYVQFHGDYGPGGGFQAGVIFAAAFFLYSMLFGLSLARKIINHSLVQIIAASGVLLYGSVGIVSMLNGKAFLDYDALSYDPVHGQHIGILIIEFGVGMTVASVMLLIFFAFSGRNAAHREKSI